VRALTTGSPVTWLATTYDGVEHNRFPIPKLFNFCRIGTSAILTILHTDFDQTAQLLHRISAAAAALQILRLTESKFSHGVRYSCCDTRHLLMHTAQVAKMPWDDADNWEDGLRSLRYLERFLLRCWQPLRNTESAEDMLIS